jgi:hypothetical protein
VVTKSPTECARANTHWVVRANATSPRPSIAWMAPERPTRTTLEGAADHMLDRAWSAAPVATEGLTGDAWITRRPAPATSAATATGRSEWVKRLRYAWPSRQPDPTRPRNPTGVPVFIIHLG